MANDALIGTLDQLRESYGQRQRATNALMGALKGMTGALSKAGRALKEYADQRDTALGDAQQALADGALVAQVRETVADPLAPDLRRELKTFSSLTAALRDASAALSGASVDVVKLERAVNVLQGVKIQDPSLAAILLELQQALQQAQRTLGETFGEALRDALAAQGVDVRGRPPRFEIERFEVAANFARRTAAISYGKEVVVPRVPLSVEAVVAAYLRARTAITGRNEDRERWLDQFYTAWQRVPHRAEDRANIVECYFQMALLRQNRKFFMAPTKSGFAEYSRAQFAHDFFELTNRQAADGARVRVAAHGATKSQAGNDEKSIWIVEGAGPNDGRYIADIVCTTGA